MAKVLAPLSEKAQELLEVLTKENRELTLAEVQELGVTGINASHFMALKNRGFLESEMVEREVTTVTKRKMNVYRLVEQTPEV